ncbi:DUF3040 domain-containing protein [Segeticoccus rhizosphaerae]|uniref:DUF3040 domain-containing protein n=1 Tax=Segeticoccus rhizosphaerae TaxID=1104777 RepID=UPI00138FE0B1|nr:DUF3040 domain-containing protein [Ornithinicoccus soli]
MPLSNDEQRQLDALERQLHIDESFALMVGGLVRRLRLRLAGICLTALGAGVLIGSSIPGRSWLLRGLGLALLVPMAYQVWAIGHDEHRRPAHRVHRLVAHLLRRLSPRPAARAVRTRLARAAARVRHPRRPRRS